MGASRQQRPTEGSEAGSEPGSERILLILLILSNRVFAVVAQAGRQGGRVATEAWRRKEE